MKHTGYRVSAWAALIGFATALSGCASGPAAQPSAYVYPQKGQTAEKQSRDTGECQTWAKQQTGFDPLTDSAKGAGVGALVGAVGGAAAGAAGLAVTFVVLTVVVLVLGTLVTGAVREAFIKEVKRLAEIYG